MGVTYEQAAEMHAHEIALTERWTPLRDHPQQQLMVYHPARFKWNGSGRRSGKTELAKRTAVSELIINARYQKRIVIAAPTFSRAKEIYFDDLRALIPRSWIKSIKESLSYMEFRTHWNFIIRLLGMNNPQVVEGPPTHRFFGDEFADWPKQTYQRHVRPALSTTGQEGSAWFYGVPDDEGTNQAEFEKYFNRGMKWPEYPDHCSFSWPSSDILSESEIAEMAEGMDADLFAQELGGQFIKTGPRALPHFTESVHVDEYYAEYSPLLPIDHTFDFGIRPAASLVAQHHQSQAWILDEIVIEDGGTPEQCEAFLIKSSENGWTLLNGLYVYGDPAGRTPGSSTTKSDYETILQYYAAYDPVLRNLVNHPPVKETLVSVRGKLRDYLGYVTLYIHPRCVRLREELRTAQYAPGDTLKQYHLLAALRYYLYKLFGSPSRPGVILGGAQLSTPAQASARMARLMR